MYSIVLMAALTAGNVTPDWHHRGGCCGCWGGCYGGCCGGCFGGCYGCWGGCYGCFGGCYGCFGGCCGGCFGGCCGGCFGGSCGGCFGGCLGGCFGGGYGDGFGAGYGAPAYPGAVVPGDGMIAPGAGVYPDSMGTPTGVPLGTPTGEPLETPTKNKGKDSEKKSQGMLTSTKAKLVVELPANAKLFIDDMPVKATASVLMFHTPALEPGQAYFYMVRIERMQDGKPVSETRRIIVRAGQVARADFKDRESEEVRTVQAK
jgi:uncharacterized protein (TIGR03000 family)